MWRVLVFEVIVLGVMGHTSFAEELSTSSVVISPHIDDDGNVWSGSGNGGDEGHIVGQAKLKVDNDGKAWWQSNYRNIYGTADPIRVARFDKRVSYQKKIDRLTGEVTGLKLVGSEIVLRKRLGRADLKYTSEGQAYFEFEGQKVLANRPARPKPQPAQAPPKSTPEVSVQPAIGAPTQPTDDTTATGSTSVDHRIDFATGAIVEGTFLNGQLIAERAVGQATPRRLADGYVYWTAPGMQPTLTP